LIVGKQEYFFVSNHVKNHGNSAALGGRKEIFSLLRNKKKFCRKILICISFCHQPYVYDGSDMMIPENNDDDGVILP